MAVVQVIENGGARLEVNLSGDKAQVVIIEPGSIGNGGAIALDAEDLKALIKRCRTVLSEIEG
jgi:hypothetical protein